MSSFKRLSLSVIVEGNDDLLMEILLFLPAKSLVRFRAVSKRWRSLIFGTLFRRRHTLHPLRRSEAQPLFFLGSFCSKYFVYNPTVPKSFPFSFPIQFRNMPILQSCNGLLLLRCSRGKEGHSYHVFNPTTKQKRDLSPLPSGASVTGIYLIFDPSLSLHYRVVCFLRAKKRRNTTIYLYDSETRKWSLVGERSERALIFSDGIYFNGGIYFVRVGSSWSRFDPDDNVTEIPNPFVHDALGSSRSKCMESNGVVFALKFCWKDRSNLLYVSEMKENEGKWSRKWCVDLNPILASSSGVEGYGIRLLGMSRGKKEEDLSLLGLREKIMMFKFYDEVFEVDNGTSKEFLKGNASVDEAHHFIGSLAPV